MHVTHIACHLHKRSNFILNLRRVALIEPPYFTFMTLFHILEINNINQCISTLCSVIIHTGERLMLEFETCQ